MNPDQIQKVGRWPVRRMVGQGGFSWVFEVEDPNLFNVRRALKMLKPQAAEGEGLMRFMREVEILSPIDDPHLVRIYEHGTDAETGNRYYVMEFLTGSDLANILRSSGPLDEARAIEVFDGVLRGLERIHALRPPVIHRDIKPPNIQITEEGVVKLIDFGIARKVDDGSVTVVGDSNLTVQNVFIGTVKYASPEQLRVKTLGPASDVFSLGLCMYEALEGHHAYQDMPELPTQSYQDVFGYYVQLDAARGALSLKFKHTPKPLQPVIRKAVAVKLGERFRDAREMRAALSQAASGKSISAPRPRPQEGREDRPTRSRAPLIAGAAVLLLAAGVAGAWLLRPVPGRIVSDPPPESGGPGPVDGPSAEQEENRRAAHDLASSFAERAEQIPEAKANGFRESLARADALWSEQQFAEADRAYRGVYSVGIQVLAGKPPILTVQSPDPLELTVGDTREIPLEASDPDGTPVTIAYEIRDPAGTDTTGTGPRLSFSPRLPGRYRIKVTATDAAGARAVEQIAANVKPGAAPQIAADVKPRPVDPSKPPSLAVNPAGPVELAFGASQVFTATPTPADGVIVEHRVIGPNGVASAPATGSSIPFRPTAAGRYRIELVARNKLGQESPKVAIAVVVGTKIVQPEGRDTPRPTNTQPRLTKLEPSGPLELKVGETREIRAQAEDKDPGDAVTISYRVLQGTQTVSQASGASFAFRPTAAGSYTIEVSARDKAGATAEARRISATVTSGSDPLLEARALLSEYRQALMEMDLQHLRLVYKMDPEMEGTFAGLFQDAEWVQAEATPLGPIEASGTQGRLRFRQRITMKLRSQDAPADFVNGPTTATLLKRADGWQIISLAAE